MSMNFNDREPETSATEAEGVLFASNPVWDRNRKRRGFGGKKVAAEPRTFAPADEPEMTLDRPIAPSVARPAAARVDPILDQPMTTTNSTLAIEDDAVLAAPTSRPQPTLRARKANSAAPAAIAAALVAVGALGAVGWYAVQPHDGVPELAPGTTESQVAVAPVTAPEAVTATAPTQVAANTAPPPAALPERAAPARSTAPSARVRPARAAPSAADASGVNASAVAATLPDGPQPYSALNPGATPQPVTPTPPTAPIQAAPEAIPATPPIAPEATPTPPTEDPASPKPESPPTS